MGLVAFELLTKLISKKEECISPNGERSFTAPCNTIYAAVAFGGVLVVLNFVSALAIGLVLRLENGTIWWKKFFSRMAHNDNVTTTEENLI